MSKQDVVSTQLAALQAAELSAKQQILEATYDAAQADMPVVPTSGFTQADMDAAKQSGMDEQKGIDQPIIDKANSDLSSIQAMFDTLKAKDDALVTKEGAESKTLSDLQLVKDKLQSVLNDLTSATAPAPIPQPEPDPVPAPVDPGSGDQGSNP